MIDLALIISNTISGIFMNLAWFILIIWGIRKIVKETPKWLNQYHENKIKEMTLSRALALKQT